jgi:hypothetical protein
MAADLKNLWAKHFEKITVAVAAAVFIAALVIFVGMRKDQNAVRTQVVRLVENIRKEQGNASLDKILTPQEKEELHIGQPALKVEDFAKELNGLPSPWDTKKDFVEGSLEIKAPVVKVVTVSAPQVQPVTDVRAVAGRATTAESVPSPVYTIKVDKGGILSDVVWAGVVGRFDLTQQREAYLAAKNHIGDGILVSRVELQRREFKPDGTWSDWQAVTPALASAAATKWPKLPAKATDKAMARVWHDAVKSMQADIRHMPFYKLVPGSIDKESQLVENVFGKETGTGTEQPDLTPPKPVETPATPAGETPAATAAPAPSETPPAAPGKEVSPWAEIKAAPTKGAEKGPAKGPAAGTGEAVSVPAGKEALTTVWAFDASVDPGKTYQYQMRVAVVNPAYSSELIQDEKTRWALEFTGPWSQPTREVSIPSLVQFFFIGTFQDRGTFQDKANLALHRWILGQWVSATSIQANLGIQFSTKVRKKITIPGVPTPMEVEVDMSPQVLLGDVLKNFPYRPEGNARPTNTNILVFADSKGRLGTRIEWEDRKASANFILNHPPGGGTGPTTTKPPEKPVEPPKPRPPVKPPVLPRPPIR